MGKWRLLRLLDRFFETVGSNRAPPETLSGVPLAIASRYRPRVSPVGRDPHRRVGRPQNAVKEALYLGRTWGGHCVKLIERKAVGELSGRRPKRCIVGVVREPFEDRMQSLGVVPHAPIQSRPHF